MWINDIDEISFDLEQDGILVKKQISKEIIRKGAWPVIVFQYREWNKNKNDYGEPRVCIHKYRKMNDSFRIEGKINLSSLDLAAEIAEIFLKWKNNVPVNKVKGH